MIVFVIGPAGSGKTEVGRALSARLGCPFVDADDLHTVEARAKMASGAALTDADRAPWLGRVRDAARDGGPAAVVACSALKREYRDVLRGAGNQVRFVALAVGEAELHRRLTARNAAGGHFMPVSQIVDQVRTWQPLGPSELDAITISGERSVDAIVQEVIAACGLGPTPRV